jgi:uncharacterized membrane protein
VFYIKKEWPLAMVLLHSLFTIGHPVSLGALALTVLVNIAIRVLCTLSGNHIKLLVSLGVFTLLNGLSDAMFYVSHMPHWTEIPFVDSALIIAVFCTGLNAYLHMCDIYWALDAASLPPSRSQKSTKRIRSCPSSDHSHTVVWLWLYVILPAACYVFVMSVCITVIVSHRD